MNKYWLGTEFYRYIDNDLIRIRITKNSDTDKYEVLCIKNDGYKADEGKYYILTHEELERDYIVLTPDGVLCIYIVHYDGLEDVITWVATNDKNMDTPYAVCRQCITDIFGMMSNISTNIIPVGMSITRDSCPSQVDFGGIFVHDGPVGAVKKINVYNDDTLEDLLKVIHTKKYDDVLRNTKQKALATPTLSNTIGWCSSLKELFKTSKFMMDFHSAMNIQEVPFSLENVELIPMNELKDIIEEKTNKTITAVYVYPYDKTINLREIKREYMLMASETKEDDTDTNVYIVGYDIDHEAKPKKKYENQELIDNKLKELGFHTM